MEELWIKIYDEYLGVLNQLSIGYSFEDTDLSHIWEMIHVVYFLLHGSPTREDKLWIADHYELADSMLENDQTWELD